ncbi:MAG: nitroreductase family protein [Parabacteroides sp.]|nr:nitroreductase family protein [Parabacteroides sp.]
MDLYEVLEKRRTYRDFSDREVSDEILEKIVGAAFKAPTNDHLRQLEFIVVRGRENIAKVIAPLSKNMAAFKELVFEVDDSGDKDKMEMFTDALPKQQKMLMDSGLLILPFFRQKQSPLLKPVEQSSLNYFASAWCALENMLLAATHKGLGAVFHIPVSDEADAIKKIVNAPEGYEFICLLTIGYPAENAFLPRQKEIHVKDRIHTNACWTNDGVHFDTNAFLSLSVSPVSSNS